MRKFLMALGLILVTYGLVFANQYIFNPYTGKLDNTVVNGSDVTTGNLTVNGTATYTGNFSNITFSNGKQINGNTTNTILITGNLSLNASGCPAATNAINWTVATGNISVYGTANSSVLAVPSAWFNVTINGTAYKVPAY